MPPNPTTVTPRPATPADTTRLVGTLTDAFLTGPLADWLIPDLHHRRVVYPRYFELVVHHALRHATVDTTTDQSAAAIWHPRTEDPPPAPFTPQELAWATGRYAPRFALFDDLFDAHHPRVPHHHLAFLAVDPDQQGHGIGTALLQHHHQTLDATTTAAYLEASTTRSRNLYLHLGYTPQPAITLPDGGPTIWPLWRPPTHGGVPVPNETAALVPNGTEAP